MGRKLWYIFVFYLYLFREIKTAETVNDIIKVKVDHLRGRDGNIC